MCGTHGIHRDAAHAGRTRYSGGYARDTHEHAERVTYRVKDAGIRKDTQGHAGNTQETRRKHAGDTQETQ